jgi:predicted Zn-dependent peptidase
MKFDPIVFNPPLSDRYLADNGLIVHFLESRQLPIITLSAYFHGGSAYDPLKKAGLADITAELMRSGGAGDRTPDEVDFDLDFAPISISSTAQSDFFRVRMRALKKDAEQAFEILADIIRRPAFDSTKLDLALSNKKDEIRRQNDDPFDISSRVLFQTVYSKHPYGVYPTLESIDNISRNDVLEYHNKYYQPDNCIISISGDLSYREVQNLISKYFGNWPKSNIDLPSVDEAAMNYQPGVYYAEKDINQANIMLGHLAMTNKNPDRYAFEVVNFALGGGGFTSRLMKELRNTAGLAYAVGTYMRLYPFMGFFAGYCQTKSESMSQAMTMILDIISDVQKNGITIEEMTIAKESIINSYVFDFDKPSELINTRALNELRGFPPDQIQKTLEAYQAVTLEQCNNVAQFYLNPDNLAIVITGNKEQFDKPPDTFGTVTVVPMEIK